MIAEALVAFSWQLGAAVTPRAAYEDCLRIAATEPVRAARLAEKWIAAEGGGAALHCLGTAQVRLGDEASATATFEQAAVLSEARGDGQAADLYGLAAESAARAVDLARARDLVERGLRTLAFAPPASEAALRKLAARFAMAEGDVDRARAELFTATSVMPEDVEGWILRAAAERRAGNLSGAESAIAAAVRLAPDDPEVQAEANRILLADE